MNHCKILLFLLCAACVGGTALADNYEQLRAKASRYAAQREWPNASAIYWLMLDQRPAETDTYADAMVSNTLAGDTATAVALIHTAMDNLVSPDSLFSTIRTRSFALGCPSIYQDLLIRARDNFPWMTRMVDRNLLSYYDYRNDGPQMVVYADKMLQGYPENTAYLRIKARGSLLCGDGPGAESIWRHILDIEPSNYDTLVDLSAYLVASGNKEAATPFIRRALDIRPTPYLQAMLAR